jgi:hypothetical protein
VISLQDLYDARGGAGFGRGAAGRHAADVTGVKSIDVFVGRDREEDLLRINVSRERELHQDAVDFVAGVQKLDLREEFLRGDRVRGSDGLAVNTQLGGGSGFIPHIDLRGRIVSDQDYREARRTRKGRYARPKFLLNLVSNSIAIQNLCQLLFYVGTFCEP